MIKCWGKGVLVSALAVLACGVLLEGTLRLYYLVKNKYAPRAQIICSDLGWKTTPFFCRTSSVPGYGVVAYSTAEEGFRVYGDIQSTNLKVFVIGDSSTQGWHVSDGKTYYSVLQNLCGPLEIFAYGTGGYGSLQEFMVLDRFMDVIKPNLIIWQFDGNDLSNNSRRMEVVSGENCYMMRPYLVDGKIIRRFPLLADCWWKNALAQTYTYRLINIMLGRFNPGLNRARNENILHEDNEIFQESVQVTSNIMTMVKARAGETPILAFCIYEGPDGIIGRTYQSICAGVGIDYIPGVTASVMAAKAKGQLVTGVENGMQVDTHFNAAGHAIVGHVLADYLAAHPQLLQTEGP